MWDKYWTLKHYALLSDYELILSWHLEELFVPICEYYEEYCVPFDTIRERIHVHVKSIIDIYRGEQLCGKNTIH